MIDEIVEATTPRFVLSGSRFAGLGRRLEDFMDDNDARAVIIDLRDFDAQREFGHISDVSRWERSLRRLERCSSETIALLDGRVQGVGLEVALACDVRIAKADTRLSWREGNRIWPGMAIYRLVQLMGRGATRRFVHSVDGWDADVAQRSGMLDVVSENPYEHSLLLAREQAGGDDPRVMRQLLQEGATTNFDDSIGLHLAACERAMRRADAGR